jgi:aminopeptidase YwaD
MFSTISKGSRRKLLLPLFALSLVASAAFAQQRRPADPGAPDPERLRAHIKYLASDQLEGRRTGTPGAEEAARYIAEGFKRFGLAPGVKNSVTFQSGPDRADGAFQGYFQAFPYVAGVELGRGNSLAITGSSSRDESPETLIFRVGEDWTPLGFSASGKIENAPVAFVGYGITDAEQTYDDYKGADVKNKIALALSGTPDGDNPHGRFTRAGELRFKAAAARAAGAKALVIIASEENFKDDKLSALKYDNAGGDAGLPVVAVSRWAAGRMLGFGPADAATQLAAFESKFKQWKSTGVGDPEALVKGLHNGALSLTTDIVRKEAPAANVVGVLEGFDPKLKDEVIVVGAHYDHLGRGGEGSLAPREGEIHHGADDNASGTAGLLELARLLSEDKEKMRRTVLFIAFGGEEEGLIGSSYYVAHPVRPLEQTVAMINMDMIGRLKDDALTVGGVGTAAEWRALVERANGGYTVSVSEPEGAGLVAKQTAPGGTSVAGGEGHIVIKSAPTKLFTLRLNEDGYGPSDHSSFYLKKIPVLFLFTGAHEDYHKPSDTADKINYAGEALVLLFARQIIYDLQGAERRPTFAVAKSEPNSRSTGFRVYLGTIPSYADSTDGLKLDGVREGSPAEAAGLKAGDKVLKLAGRDVRNVYDYTQALSEMKAGQEYEVEVLRDGQRLTLKVTPAVRK